MLSSYLGLATACPSYFSKPRPGAGDGVALTSEEDQPKVASMRDHTKDSPTAPTVKNTD